jgi:ANTAR domain-containing protein
MTTAAAGRDPDGQRDGVSAHDAPGALRSAPPGEGVCNGVSTHTDAAGSPGDAVGPPTWRPHGVFPCPRLWCQVRCGCRRSGCEGRGKKRSSAARCRRHPRNPGGRPGLRLSPSHYPVLDRVPLQWGAVNVGVLDLYRKAPGSLSEVQLRDVMSAADMAALMFLGVRTDPGDGVWLDHSVHGRAEIHQATGMVLAQLGGSATDALARMRAYAFAQERSLSDVAHDVVCRRLRFTQDMM